MTIRRINCIAAIVTAIALLVTSVGCSTPAPQAPAEPQTDHSHATDSTTTVPIADAPAGDSHDTDGTTNTSANGATNASTDGNNAGDSSAAKTTTTNVPAGSSHNANTTTKTSADDHAGHNHTTNKSTNKSTTNKPATGTTVVAPGDNTPGDNTHNHQSPTSMDVAYVAESGGKFTLVIKDCQGELLLERKGLTKKASSHQIAPGIMEFTWVKSNDPGGYERLYINRRTCQVSDVIAGSQATDGNRIVYSEIRNGKLNIIVRDLFDANGYTKTTVINEAYTKIEFPLMNITKHGNDQVAVSFVIDENKTKRVRIFSLYEKGEKKPDFLTK